LIYNSIIRSDMTHNHTCCKGGHIISKADLAANLIYLDSPEDIATQAERTFAVTVAPKTTHPWKNRILATNQCLAINGVAGKVLKVQRGKTYTFNFAQAGVNHQLYFTADLAGGPVGQNVQPLTYDPAPLVGTPLPFASGTAIIKILPDMPNVIYYQCRLHQFEGGIINVE
jgi:hypothetical protein